MKPFSMIIAALALPALIFGADPTSSFSGKIYYSWDYDLSKSADGENEFSLKRTYLNYDKHLSEEIALHLTTDVYHDGHALMGIQKKAYIAKQTGAGDLFIGLQGMNIFNVIEKNWGYRFVAKNSMDIHHFSSSADLGVGFKTKLMDKLALHATITNGTGYKAVEDDKYKKFTLQAAYGELDLGKHQGFNAGAVGSFERYGADNGDVQAKTIMALFGGFSNETLKVGGEFDLLTDSDDAVGSKRIIAGTLDFKLPIRELHIFSKIELFDGDLSAKDDNEMTIIAGINHKLGKGVYLAPNIHLLQNAEGDIDETKIYLNLEIKY